MKKPFELLILICLLATLVRVTFRPTEPSATAPGISNLRVDGIGIGMSYAEVINIRGRPVALGWEGSSTFFDYSPRSVIARRVWFSDGAVVFCEGSRLTRENRKLFQVGLPAKLLFEQFGQPESLTFFADWFPDFGVVISRQELENPDLAVSQAIGLRDVNYPSEWVALSPGGSSLSEPWRDDFYESWSVGHVHLGTPATSVENAGGLDIVYEAGFVRGIRNPSKASYNSNLGHHLLNTELTVGERPNSEVFEDNPSWDRKLGPQKNVKIIYSGDVITSIDLYVEDDELFSALAAAK